MDSQKPKRSRRKYDASFKQEVVKMIASGRSVPDIARSLGVGENLIYRWKKQALAISDASAAAENGFTQVSLSDHLALQKQLRELQMEHEILKKVVGIFSRPQ
jgi:transposase